MTSPKKYGTIFTMLNDILFILWFILPAGVANSTPVVTAHIPGLRSWNHPLDYRIKLRGQRLLGKNKTWRGLITGILGGIACSVLLHSLYTAFPNLGEQVMPLNYEQINPILFGFLSGVGALMADAVKSGLKRQRNIPPGTNWFPFDQLDYAIGLILATIWYVPLDWYLYSLLLATAFGGHYVISYAGYILGIKENPL